MSASVLGHRHLECRDLHSYLKTLSPILLDRLYNHPATCLAVYRELTTLAKHYVMRILFVEKPVSQSVVTSWADSSARLEHTVACEMLSNLRIWNDHSLPGGLPGWNLSDTYRRNLRIALLGGGKSWTGAGTLTLDKYAKDITHLDNYAMERWECILHFMVSSREGASGISKDIRDILLHSGLMKLEESDTDPFITPAGFQFVLLDTSTQVWYFILQYLETCEKRGMDLVDTLSFLFQLSFTTLGKDYSTDGMTENQLVFLQHLREFGLVYQRKRKSQRFYPTRLAVNVSAGVSTEGEANSDRHQQGYIVVDTNYKLYAYTDSPLQIALLSLFCSLIYRFPGFVVCNLTRDSVRQALMHGITADQIISFLRSHCHSEMLKHTPVLPPTITDQIQLWELERDRFKFNEGVLYNQFLSQKDFEMLREYASDIGVLIWQNQSKRLMVVSRSGHDDVKRFWKRNKPS